MIVVHALILSDAIDAKSPISILDRHGGFASRALTLSWTNLTKCCRRVVTDTFFGTNSEESFRRLCSEADLKGLPSNSTTTKEARTKVVIFSRQQMDSLQALAQFDHM